MREEIDKVRAEERNRTESALAEAQKAIVAAQTEEATRQAAKLKEI
jgi:hypothetical protein